MGKKPIIDTGFQSHNDFLQGINEVVRKGDTTPAMNRLCANLNNIIECRQINRLDRDAKRALARNQMLYDDIKHYVSDATENLRLEGSFDPARIFSKATSIRVFDPEDRIKLELLAMLRDGAYTRLGKCHYSRCNRYFFAHRSADIQKYCNSPNKGLKSPCAVAGNMELRKRRNEDKRKQQAKEAERRKEKQRIMAAAARQEAMEKRLCEIVKQRGGLPANAGKYHFEREIKAQLIKEKVRGARNLAPSDIREICQHAAKSKRQQFNVQKRGNHE
jgi:hypothetical protein